jgi:hypothetical protein
MNNVDITQQTPSLEDIQAAFKRHLQLKDNDIVNHIVDTDRLAGSERLAIYGNAYYARLIEALEQDYEALHTLLGDDQFTRLCESYIGAYPSRRPSLRFFGAHMSDYLSSHEPYNRHPYLQEMAILEWMLIEAFDATDAPVVSEGDAAVIPPERWPALKLILHPSVRWFNYHWNILPVWKAATENNDIPELVRLDSKAWCVVWRHNLMTRYRSLDTDEVVVMKAVQGGENFAGLCEQLAEQGTEPEQVPMRAAGILKTWLSSGMVSRLHY